MGAAIKIIIVFKYLFWQWNNVAAIQNLALFKRKHIHTRMLTERKQVIRIEKVGSNTFIPKY